MRPFVPLVGLAVFVACSSSSTNGSSGGPTARFTLASADPPPFLDVPFPTDAYLSAGKVAIPGIERLFTMNADFLNRELATMNGFSRIAAALFYVDDLGAPPDANGNTASATIDPATLPHAEGDCTADASAVFLLDLAATDPAKARVACRAAFHDDRDRTEAARPVIAVGSARGVLL